MSSAIKRKNIMISDIFHFFTAKKIEVKTTSNFSHYLKLLIDYKINGLYNKKGGKRK